MLGTASTILLWLFIVNLAIAFGAGLYEPGLSRPGGSVLPGKPAVTGMPKPLAGMIRDEGSRRSPRLCR